MRTKKLTFAKSGREKRTLRSVRETGGRVREVRVDRPHVTARWLDRGDVLEETRIPPHRRCSHDQRTRRLDHATPHDTAQTQASFGALVWCHLGDWITLVGPGRAPTIHQCLYGRKAVGGSTTHATSIRNETHHDTSSNVQVRLAASVVA